MNCSLPCGPPANSLNCSLHVDLPPLHAPRLHDPETLLHPQPPSTQTLPHDRATLGTLGPPAPRTLERGGALLLVAALRYPRNTPGHHLTHGWKEWAVGGWRAFAFETALLLSPSFPEILFRLSLHVSCVRAPRPRSTTQSGGQSPRSAPGLPSFLFTLVTQGCKNLFLS